MPDLLTTEERINLLIDAVNILTHLFPGHLQYNQGMALIEISEKLNNDRKARKHEPL